MADRHDIDALLVGALYGELSSSDHQRLEAHLANHPQDRAALDAMTHTRGRLREGLAAVSDAEPPAALSALLLQEAARRAPARKPAGAGLWAWFENAMRSMAAHPGLAAAAAFVLVAGVAGSFVLTGGSPAYEASAPSPQAAAPAAPAEPAPPQEIATGAAPDPAYQAGLAEPRPGDVAVAATVPAENRWARGRGDEARAKDDVAKKIEADRASSFGYLEKPSAKAPNKVAVALDTAGAEAGAKGGDKLARAERRYVPVTTPEPTIKEEEAEGAALDGYARQAAAAPATESVAPRPPSPAPAAGGRAGATAAPYDASREQERDAWASAMHRKVLAAIKRRDCASAAAFAAEISVRASDYYTKRVSADRAILPCKPQIDRERKKEAERRSRAPTKDSVNDEPAATTSH